ncbi:GNAT family N-acetyltransferase [Eubacteriales bacterium OttesenSCG-928-N14]|nr:GNAT family N-acetyltransferase [Eubacteriales bacterium OttesenSCG-928-N14]
MKIEIIKQNKESYLPLLLIADPEEAMIMRYLPQGTLYVLQADNRPIGVAVTVDVGGGNCELKNIGIDETLHGRGYGGILLRHVLADAAKAYSGMYVGTADAGVAFYEHFWFAVSHVEKDFFVINYPQPIFDNGIQCVDMIYLHKNL